MRFRRAISATIGLACVAVGLSAVTIANAAGDEPAGSSGGVFVPVTPARVYDWQGVAANRVTTSSPKTFQVTGVAGVPSTGVSAVVLDVSGATSSTGVTNVYLKTNPADTTASMLTVGGDASTGSNTAIVKPSSTGKVTVAVNNQPVGLNVDVQGYFTDSSVTGQAGGFVPIDPSRMVGTNQGIGLPQARLNAGTTYTTQIAGRGDIPANATAVFANVRIANSPADGWAKIAPAGLNLATVPTGTYYEQGKWSDAGQSIKLGTNGAISILLSSGPADVMIDVQGYFTAADEDGGGFTPLPQTHYYDTRTDPEGVLQPGEKRTIEVAGKAGVPDDGTAGAIATTVLATNWTATGAVEVYNADLDDANGTSNIGFVAPFTGEHAQSTSLVELSGDGELTLRNNSTGTVHVVLAAQGWFWPVLIDEDDGQTGESGDPAAWSADQFANERGITSSEATESLATQVEIEQAIGEIEVAVPEDTLAGMYISNEPTRLNIRLTEEPEGSQLDDAIAASGIPVAVVTNAEMTVAERTDIIDSHIEGWLDAIPSTQGVYVDEASDDVVLQVADEDAALAAASEPSPGERVQAAATESTGQTIDDGGLSLRFEKNGELESSNKGGRWMSGCTSGFPAKVGSTKVILTAAHCGKSQSYRWFNGGGPFPLKYVGRRWDSKADIEWFRPTKHKVEARYFEEATKSGSGTKVLGSARNVQGAFKCHNGLTTGSSCGTLTSVEYRPTYANACNGVRCSQSFVYVAGRGLRGKPGDSGGPWFLYGYGYGIHMCNLKDGSGPGCYSKLGNLPDNVKILKF